MQQDASGVFLSAQAQGADKDRKTAPGEKRPRKAVHGESAYREGKVFPEKIIVCGSKKTAQPVVRAAPFSSNIL